MEKILDLFMRWNYQKSILKKKDSFSDYINHINTNCISGSRYNPTVASLCITESCNLDCTHCYQANNGKTMTYEETCAILEQLREHQVLHLTITGGEPFLHPQILDIVKYAKLLKFAITLQTNGLLINESFVSTIRESFTKLDYIQVSLEGSTREIHNLQRQNGYDELLKNIKILIQNEIKVVVNLTPTKYNQSDIYNTFLLANNLKVDGFGATPLAYLGRGHQAMEPDEEELLRQEYLILSHPSPYTQYYGGVSGELLHLASVPCFKTALVEEYSRSKITGDNHLCKGGSLKLHIGADFEVYPCVFAQNPDLSMGNLLKQSLKQIWFEDYKNTTFFCKKRTLQFSKCENCALLFSCHGGCPGIAFEKYKDINKPDPRCLVCD